MTIVTYRSGWCFADDANWDGNLITSRAKKIAWRKRDGAIAAASGDGAACDHFLKTAMRARMPKDNGTEGESGCSGVIFYPDGTVEEYSGGRCCTSQSDFHAIGMGREVATGAFLVGASAMEAARSACIAFSWASGLHGVNHEGKWVFLPYSEVFRPIHEGRIPVR